MVSAEAQKMEYRSLGKTGLKVSVFGYGNWLNSDSKDNQEITNKCVQEAYKQGINFFDTAELYGHGEGERQLGIALKTLECERKDLVVTTKLFWRGRPTELFGPNGSGLSRQRVV